MKKILSATLLIAALALSATAQVQRHGKFGQGDRMGNMHKGEGMKKMAKDLNFSDAQKQQMQTIHKDSRTKLEALRAEKNITVGEMESRRKAILDEQKTKMDAVLTSDQKAKLEQRKADMDKKRQEMQVKRQGRMKKELNLSNEQAEKIKALNEKSRNEMKAIRENTSLTQEEKKAKAKAIKEATKAERLSILTTEQKTKLEQMRSQQKGKNRQNGQCKEKKSNVMAVEK